MIFFFFTLGVRLPKIRGNRKKRFERIDDFDKKIIINTVHSFYGEQKIPTAAMIFEKLKANDGFLAGKFPYKLSTLKEILKSIGFKFRRVERRAFIMESSRLKIWRHKYLTELRK